MSEKTALLLGSSGLVGAELLTLCLQSDLYKKWMELHAEVRRPINAKYQSNKPNDRQEKAYVSFDDVEKIRNKLKKGSMSRLLLSMYTMIPPVRSDYDKIAIYKTIM